MDMEDKGLEGVFPELTEEQKSGLRGYLEANLDKPFTMFPEIKTEDMEDNELSKPITEASIVKSVFYIPREDGKIVFVDAKNNNMEDNIHNRIIREIKHLYIECPDCRWMEDEQYTCTTCWCEGGNGKINVYEWLSNHKNLLTQK